MIESTDLAATSVGRELQQAELHKKARRAAGALLAVAILQTIFGLVIYGIARAQISDDPSLELQPEVFVVLFGVAALYYGLWLWARRSPLPAAIVGLVIYLTLLFAGALVDPTTLLQGILVKIIIIVVLVKAIQAGLQYRQLKAEAGEASSVSA